MITEIITKFGFVKDDDSLRLKELFKDNTKFKEVHIDIYPDNPFVSSKSFMLLLRTFENDVTVSNDSNRVILKKNDTYETHFVNILFSKITECFVKISETCSELILNVQNIYYKITVLN